MLIKLELTICDIRVYLGLHFTVFIILDKDTNGIFFLNLKQILVYVFNKCLWDYLSDYEILAKFYSRTEYFNIPYYLKYILNFQEDLLSL